MGLHWLQLSSSLCLINDQNLDGWSKWSDCEKSRARWIKAHPSHSLRPGLTSTLRFVTLERVKMWCFQPNSWQFVWHNSYGILKFLRGFLCKHLYIRHTVDGQINQTLTIYPRCHPRTPQSQCYIHRINIQLWGGWFNSSTQANLLQRVFNIDMWGYGGWYMLRVWLIRPPTVLDVVMLVAIMVETLLWSFLFKQAHETGTGCGVVGGNHGRNVSFPISFSIPFQFLVGENHGRNCSFSISFSIPFQFLFKSFWIPCWWESW